MKTGVCTFGIMVLAVVLNGCVIVVDEGEGDVDASWATSYSSTDADEDLAKRVGTVIDEDPDLRTEDLRVSVRKGVVTLRGEVSDIKTLERVVDTASRVEGVRRVISKITVEVASAS